MLESLGKLIFSGSLGYISCIPALIAAGGFAAAATPTAVLSSVLVGVTWGWLFFNKPQTQPPHPELIPSSYW